MVKTVFIARKNDGLIFCEVSDDLSNDKNFTNVRFKALDYLKNMQNKSEIGSVNIDNQNFQI